MTRKITRAVAAIESGREERLFLGNLDSLRDWGDARDYVLGMWMILQQDKPDDYVLATGEQHSVREFVELAFAEIGRQISWRGSGETETGVDKSTGDILVEVDPQYYRPTEVDSLLAIPQRQKISSVGLRNDGLKTWSMKWSALTGELIKAESHGR